MVKKYWLAFISIVILLVFSVYALFLDRSKPVSDVIDNGMTESTTQSKSLDELKRKELDMVYASLSFDLRGYEKPETLEEHIEILLGLHPYSKRMLGSVLVDEMGFDIMEFDLVMAKLEEEGNVDWQEMAYLQANILHIGMQEPSSDKILEHLIQQSWFTPNQARAGVDRLAEKFPELL
ncbi:MAG: hypothetical protein LBV67_06140 [Streptococcaceae bacterium]|nr:hypothetical protein [Streptococcaceae bacterium]